MSELTGGSFSTEEETKAYLDGLLKTAEDLFAVEKEVAGVFQSLHVKKGVFIDYILWPKRKLIDRGWSCGVIGIEAKKSGHPAGPLVAQAEDYMQSVWTFRTGVSVVLNSIYLFPAFPCYGVCASILAQRRIGFVCDYDNRLGLSLNHTTLLRHAYDGDVVVGTASNLRCGMKAGSR
jgi:hypothetical protein